MPGAVIFDLDGLLLESEQVWSEAKERLTNERGGRWKAAAENAMLGMSSPEWAAYMRDELGLAMEPSAISREVVRLVSERYAHGLPLLPGADGAVRRLAARWPLGLASSSNREIIDLVLRRAGWSRLFAATVSSEEVERGKPAPDVYLAAAGKLGVDPRRCVALEDSSAGIRSAAAAGCPVVAIPNRAYSPQPEVLESAAIVLDSLDEVGPDVVERAGAAAT